jgi:hypothetical protein
MKKLLLSIIVCISLTSCAKILPLRGRYQEVPLKSKFAEPIDLVWEKVIDFISDTGQEVQLVDKSSGLIISSAKISSGPSLSNEDNKGVLINAESLIVVERFNHDYPLGQLDIHEAVATWTIRVKTIKDGNTELSTLLHVKRVDKVMGKFTQSFRGKSTGNYEKWLLDNLGERISSK